MAGSGWYPAAVDATTEKRESAEPLLLYDGSCGLCHRAVRWLLRADREGVLTFAPLQGETTDALRERFPQIPTDLSTVVLVDLGAVHLRSRAFIVVSRHLPYPWRINWWFRWMPRWLTDPFYRLVARIRYRLFGRRELCDLPNPDLATRFLP